jgi:hypothetical protein
MGLNFIKLFLKTPLLNNIYNEGHPIFKYNLARNKNKKKKKDH